MLSIAVQYLFEAIHLLLVGRLQSSFAGPCPVVFFFPPPADNCEN